MPQLEAKDVTLRFGGVVALDSLSFTAAPDSITALIGPNGAGKTTLFNVVTRLYEPNLGSVLLDGQELLTTKAHDIAQLGIARTFQNLALVPGLTVLDNVMIGEHSSTTGGFLISLAGLQFLGREQAARRRGMELLDRLGLAQYAKSPAAGLPFGTLKRIELARALASNPTTLLLDLSLIHISISSTSNCPSRRFDVGPSATIAELLSCFVGPLGITPVTSPA